MISNKNNHGDFSPLFMILGSWYLKGATAKDTRIYRCGSGP